MYKITMGKYVDDKIVTSGVILCIEITKTYYSKCSNVTNNLQYIIVWSTVCYNRVTIFEYSYVLMSCMSISHSVLYKGFYA